MSVPQGAWKGRRVSVPIKDIRVTVFLRKALDLDRVVQFAELYEAGAEVDPLVLVRGTHELIAGRHRLGGLEMIGRSDADCIEVDPPHDLLEFLAISFKDNVGGSLPPSKADILFVLRQFIEAGGSEKKAVDLFSDPYPVSFVRRYYKDAKSEVATANLRRAITAVASGKTVAEAASEFRVDPQRLKQEISGNREKRKGFAVSAVKTALTSRYKSNSLKTAGTLKRLIDKFDDGEVAEEQVREVFAHVRHLLETGRRSYADWVKRFEARLTETKGRAKKRI